MTAAKRFRPKLTFSIMQWALLDVAGLLVLAIGGLYLIRGDAAFAGFPSSTLEAVACVVVGVGVVFVAAVKMLAEVMAQAPASGQDGPRREE
jgi:hypothetical protein